MSGRKHGSQGWETQAWLSVELWDMIGQEVSRDVILRQWKLSKVLEPENGRLDYALGRSVTAVWLRG